MGAPKGNKYALGNNGGRPPKYKTPEEMQVKIDEYFNWIATTEDECITWTGLALYLGFCSRTALTDYGNKKEFKYTIKKALMIVEHHYESLNQKGGGAGAIFALKNFNWKDKQEIEQSHSIKNPFEGLSTEELKKIAKGDDEDA